MSDPFKDVIALPSKGINTVIEEALSEVDAERAGEQLGLYCSWDGINRSVGKYFRFNHVNLFAAKMGMGKSYVLNQLHFDLTDTKDNLDVHGNIVRKALNRNFKFEVDLLHFGFEMDSKDEVIRQTTRLVNKSHNYLLSSQWDYDDNRYNQLTDTEFNDLNNKIHYLKNRPITYIETPGTCSQIYKTVREHIARKLKTNPNTKFIISLDHYLLVRKYGGESDMEHIANVARLALTLRKEFKAMVIILGQMNNNIQSNDRVTDPRLHYPNDSDIYMGSQLNWACDNIYIFPYRPEMLNIDFYGTDKIPTKELAICSVVKARKGVLGDIYFKESLKTGKFIEVELT